MGLRFRKSIKILPGVKLNLNKNSHSWTFGGKGLHYTVNKKTGKATQSVDLPGGFSYTETRSLNEQELCGENKARENIKMKENSNTQKPFYKKKWFIAVIVVIILAIIGGSLGGGEPEQPFDKIASENGIPEKTAKSIAEVCGKVGVEPEKLEFQSVAENECTAFYTNYLIRIGIENNKVNLITSMQGILYENDKIVNKASDIFVSDDDYSTLVTATKVYAEEMLKNPDSAKWPESYKEYNVKKDGNEYIVSCVLKAENSFGAMTKNNVTAKFEWDAKSEENPTLKDIQFK